MSRFLGVIALAGTPAAHGCGAEVAECAIDADCDQGQACEASNCVPLCGTDADCLQGEVCLEGTTTSSRICRENDVFTDQGLVDTTIVLVRDTSSAECDDEAPGADIAFVLLENRDGEVEAWGKLVEVQVHGEANVFANVDHIDGSRPEAGADSCPPMTDASIVSLGCEGSLAVTFADEDGAAVPLRSGEHRVRVGERGAQCEDVEQDSYDVFLCPGATSGEDVPQACGVQIGAGAGERVFDL